jgi:hypothetical protein
MPNRNPLELAVRRAMRQRVGVKNKRRKLPPTFSEALTRRLLNIALEDESAVALNAARMLISQLNPRVRHAVSGGLADLLPRHVHENEEDLSVRISDVMRALEPKPGPDTSGAAAIES